MRAWWHRFLYRLRLHLDPPQMTPEQRAHYERQLAQTMLICHVLPTLPLYRGAKQNSGQEVKFKTWASLGNRDG